jgi:hypothetical protein
MKVDITPEECALILDALSALPLARSLNTFQKVMRQYQEEQQRLATVPESAPQRID